MSRIVEIARTQLGVAERTGKNDGTPATRYMRGDELPWCAGFVLWCLEQAELLTLVPGGYWPNRSVEVFERALADAGMTLGRALVPAPGDIVFFRARAGSDAGRGRHCGLVEGVDRTHFTTIEGNVSNRVASRRWAIADPEVTSFGRVALRRP